MISLLLNSNVLASLRSVIEFVTINFILKLQRIKFDGNLSFPAVSSHLMAVFSKLVLRTNEFTYNHDCDYTRGRYFQRDGYVVI